LRSASAHDCVSLQSDQRTWRRPGLLVVLAVCWGLGVWLGSLWGGVWLWLVSACFLTVVMLIMAVGRWWAARGCAWLAVVAVAGGWAVVHQQHAGGDDVARFVGGDPQLARVTGIVDGPTHLIDPRRGIFGRFSYKQPATVFMLGVESIEVDGKPQPAGGKLYARLGQADHRIRAGDRIRVMGWLGAIRGPSNPGQKDFSRYLADRNIRGRISLANRGNWELLQAGADGWWYGLRRRFREATISSLHLGLGFSPKRSAFLDTILLGRRGGDLADLDEHFRRVGLAHLLAVSGAHLAILLGLVWLVARCLISKPRWVMFWVLMVLGLYLLVVELRVPIVRASVMAVLFGVGRMTGRRMGGMDLLALAAVAVLIWRPGELFSPGFQLSFGVVGALLLFTGRVSGWLCPWLPAAHQTHGWWVEPVRWGVSYLAVSLIAFFVALPIVAYHFHFISPLSVVISLAAWPLVAVVLAVGYLKMFVGLALPSAGFVMAGPLEWSADGLIGLVKNASSWPGATVYVSGQPSWIWVFLMLGVVGALLSGRLTRWWAVLILAGGVCVWGLLDTPGMTKAAEKMVSQSDQAALKLNMLSVGDGSCYLIRLGTGGGGHTLMFDCGSQAYTDVGVKSIVPALRGMNVSRIDTLILSHANLDHFNGSLAVVDRIGVGRVLVPPQMLAAAQRAPDSAVALLLSHLRRRGMALHGVGRGWGETHGDARLDILWPPGDLTPPSVNDTSLVLSVRVAGRRLILNGDIQQWSLRSLLDLAVDLRADVTDLPHHGSVVAASPEWLRAVGPAVVLQSSGPGRLRADKWAGLLDGLAIKRLVTARAGMVELTIDPDGHIRWDRFVDRRDGR